jgi:hypothetical protein
MILTALVDILNSANTETDFALARNYHRLPRQRNKNQLYWNQV